MGIQLKSLFQGIIINLIIDNMKTILAFLALAALAAARPQGDGDATACPDEMPIQCDDGLCVVAAADCSAKRDEDDVPACPDEIPIQCDGKYIFYFFYLCT